MSLISWFKNRKENWALVKTITLDNVKNGREIGKVYYHLYESNRQNRRIEIKSSGMSIDTASLAYAARNFPIYQEKIYRWEKGRFDPEIPGYNDIPEEDTANALKGKI